VLIFEISNFVYDVIALYWFSLCLTSTAGLVGALPVGQQPAHHMAAEDVEDHVQVEACPLGLSLEFRDVPRRLKFAISDGLPLALRLIEDFLVTGAQPRRVLL